MFRAASLAQLFVGGVRSKGRLLSAGSRPLKRLQGLAGAASVLSTKTITFHQAATIFDGGEPNPDSVLMKAKSDYVTEAMT